MNKKIRIFSIIILLTSLWLSSCASKPEAPAQDNRDVLFQVSTIDALTSGNYDGVDTVGGISQKGDFGLGTFEGVDGEMVMLDGIVYQVKDTGKVVVPEKSVNVPFAAVTYFDTDISKDVTQIQTYDGLKTALDQLIVKKDRFYAIRIDGLFSKIQVRSEAKQQKPYPILSEVMKKQAVFNYENVKGTLVGWWCPNDIGSLNAPGYHLHFISDDRAKGGHVLDVTIDNATVKLDETRFFDMELGVDAAKSAGIQDQQSEIKKVESK